MLWLKRAVIGTTSTTTTNALSGNKTTDRNSCDHGRIIIQRMAMALLYPKAYYIYFNYIHGY